MTPPSVEVAAVVGCGGLEVGWLCAGFGLCASSTNGQKSDPTNKLSKEGQPHSAHQPPLEAKLRHDFCEPTDVVERFQGFKP